MFSEWNRRLRRWMWGANIVVVMGGPLSIGAVIGMALGVVAYLVAHGVFDHCFVGDACWVEIPGWMVVGGVIGGIAGNIYKEITGKDL